MKWLRTLIVLSMLGGLAATAVAQAPGQTPPRGGGGGVAQGGGGGGGAAQKRERIKQRILAMRAAEITTELQLDEATAAKLFPVLSKYDDVFVKLLAENVQLRRDANAAAARGDDRALEDLIDKLVANQRARWDTQEARFKDVRKVLSTQQAARILVVLPQIDQRIQNQLRKALGGGGGGAGGGKRRRGGRGGGGAGAGGDPPDDDDDDDPLP